jgi:hypothetical protein
MYGAQVIPIRLRLSPPLRYAAAALSRSAGRRGPTAHRAPAYIIARSVALAGEVRRLRPLTAIIALGTDLYDLNRVADQHTPVATYDDGTFASFARHQDSELRRIEYPMREVARWADLQMKACRRASVCCTSTQWAARSLLEDYALSPIAAACRWSLLLLSAQLRLSVASRPRPQGHPARGPEAARQSYALRACTVRCSRSDAHANSGFTRCC